MSSIPPTTFTSFPRLPLELRDQIWNLSLPPPRLIHLQTERGQIRLPGRLSNRTFSHVWAKKKLPVPSMLHACHDSRTVGLRHYELAFDSNCRPAREDFPELHDLPEQRGGRVFTFPFERKAMVYVDLERDIIVTSHRRLGHRPPRGGWPKDECDEPRFAAWPVAKREFKIETFREAVPEAVYTRIRTFVATFVFSIRELFLIRVGRGMMSERRVLVVKSPFRPDVKGKHFIDCLTMLPFRQPGAGMKGKVRSLRRVGEVEVLLLNGTLWDWVADQETDERMAARAANVESYS